MFGDEGYEEEGEEAKLRYFARDSPVCTAVSSDELEKAESVSPSVGARVAGRVISPQPRPCPLAISNVDHIGRKSQHNVRIGRPHGDDIP